MSSLSRAGLLSSCSACAGASAQTMPELVSRDRLRVCADPADMPFSDRKREGFENKIAEIVADELKLPLHYYWMPQGPGFVRNTLGDDMCDLIIGYAADSDIVDHSNPYYASTYVLVYARRGPVLNRCDARGPAARESEAGRHRGDAAGRPFAAPRPAHKAKIYPLLVDRRYASPVGGRDP